MDKEFIENPVEAYEKLKQECEFSNLRIIQLQETLSQYETELSTKDCIVETCKAQYKELKAENEKLKVYKSITPLKVKMLVQILDEIKTFIKKEIEYFDHDAEYQYDWKELMELIKNSEVE